MAPVKKEKTEKVTGDEATDVVLKYLRKQNRPYSATDVSANLHNKVTKVAAQKILKQLFEKNAIAERASGKQFVYHALQVRHSLSVDSRLQDDLTLPKDTSIAPSTEELNAMTEETTTIQNEIRDQRAHLRLLKSKLANMNANRRLTIDELSASIARLQTERERLLGRLEPLRAGNAIPVTREERAKLATEQVKWNKAAKRRRAIRDEMWAQVRDVAGDKAVDLKEALGIE